MLYDFLRTVTNMAPSIMLSVATSGLLSGLGVAAGVANAAGRIAGAGSMGLSAAGNAYNQAIKEGYDADRARTYAALIGNIGGFFTICIGRY